MIYCSWQFLMDVDIQHDVDGFNVALAQSYDDCCLIDDCFDKIEMSLARDKMMLCKMKKALGMLADDGLEKEHVIVAYEERIARMNEEIVGLNEKNAHAVAYIEELALRDVDDGVLMDEEESVIDIDDYVDVFLEEDDSVSFDAPVCCGLD